MPQEQGCSIASTSAVLDFDPRDVDEEVTARTRQLLGRVLAVQGPTGLAQALHVTAPRAAQLKHRVACVTCRSRLDTLALSLSAVCSSTAATKVEDLPPLEFPAPLTAWLAADASRGLEPAPRALRDPNALAAFLAAFGGNSHDGMECGGQGPGAGGRSGGRSGGVDRCLHHAPRGAALARVPGTTVAISGAASVLLTRSGRAPTPRDRDRYIGILQHSLTDAEWRKLGAVDIDSSMCDLFAWLGDRGLCSACIDAVTGALLEVRRAVTGNCTCSRCLGFCGKAAAGSSASTTASESGAHPALAPVADPGGPAELLRVQGQLRAICGVYRLEALPFNGRPVYKKERAEAFLLYTSLKDWMISGKADAGGSKCEGWAYVTDPAETPDEVCGVWKVSGPRGWEEDPTLCVTVFEGLPEDMRVAVGYDDGSSIARRLTADDRGVLMVPLQERDVLEEVLWTMDEAPPVCVRSGVCMHVTTAEMAQLELRCWLRWLLRERLDCTRRTLLAQAQVAASLCRIFAGAALQQLEAAAEAPPPATPTKKASKKAGKKAARPSAGEDDAKVASAAATGPSTPQVASADRTAAAAAASTSSLSPKDRSTPKSAESTISGSCHASLADSDESASTRASSEEPNDADKAQMTLAARRLMEQMGWNPAEAVEGQTPLATTEVEEWHEQHPNHRKAVDEERQKLKDQFMMWAGAAVR